MIPISPSMKPIARYGISNPQEQARLAAQRVKEIG